ncbi:MAG: sensor histidine kinase, partial [Bacteroidota bacterium]
VHHILRLLYKRASLHLSSTSYAYSVLAEVNRLRGFDSISLTYNKRCAKYANLANNEQAYSSRLTLIGKNYFELNQMDSALWYFQEAVDIKESIGDSILLPIAYESLALFYAEQSFLGKATEYYLKGIEIAQTKRRDYIYVNLLNHLAHLLATNGQTQKAETYAQEALVLADSMQLEVIKAHILVSLGIIAKGKGGFKSSDKFHKAALDIYKKKQLPAKVVDQLVRLAQLAFDNQHYELAAQYQEAAYALADSTGNKRDQLWLEMLEAKILFKQKQHVNSQNAFQEVLDKAIEQKNIDVQLIAWQGIGETATQNGQFQLAAAAFENSSKLKDSLNQRTQVKYAQQLEAQYQRTKQEEKIVNLRYNNSLKDVELAANRKQRFFLIVMVVLALFAAGLGFYLFQWKRKSERLLQEKNETIKKALNEKDLLLREIHHRVKNNLQVISSLLKLQSRYVKDPNALTAINEGRTRVRSMALIHQNLYQKENLTGVRVKQYFSKLLEELFATYRIDEGKIKLDTQIDDLNLDVDTIIPIGLIINELVTNALKYAFNDKEQGLLTIKLREETGQLLLQVADNGVGILKAEAIEKPETFGFRLIKALSEKLEAKIHLDTQKGTSVSLLISSYQKAA